MDDFGRRAEEFDSRVEEFDSRVEEFESRVEELGFVEWRNEAAEWSNLYFWATVLIIHSVSSQYMHSVAVQYH